MVGPDWWQTASKRLEAAAEKIQEVFKPVATPPPNGRTMLVLADGRSYEFSEEIEAAIQRLMVRTQSSQPKVILSAVRLFDSIVVQEESGVKFLKRVNDQIQPANLWE